MYANFFQTTPDSLTSFKCGHLQRYKHIYIYKYIFRSNSRGLAPLGPARLDKFINLATLGPSALASRGNIYWRCCRVFFRPYHGFLFTVPYFSVGFSRLVRFDRTPAFLVCKGERNLGRVPKPPRGAQSGFKLSPGFGCRYKPRWRLFDQSVRVSKIPQ